MLEHSGSGFISFFVLESFLGSNPNYHLRSDVLNLLYVRGNSKFFLSFLGLIRIYM